MKADLSFVHRLFVCGVLIFVCGFLARTFGADFLVRIFRYGFFGADFSVRIFRCGFFGADFCADFFCGFFLHGDRRESDKKIQQKIHQKILPKILPKISSLKIPPKILPKSLSGHSPVDPHLDSKEVRVHTWMPLWRLAAKVHRLSGNRWQGLTQG